ncbi:MAG: acetyltransferase [Anaerolineae bacterium]|nr:acetyltransferase [Anaerolineae bacterium]MDW8172846.1 DapH/DapD/GlmU-related protein [Anaerolineae bacterium]
MSHYVISQFPPGPVPEPKRLSEQPTVHPTARLWQCQLGAWTEVGAHNLLIETSMGDYSYTDDQVSMIYTTVGKFCSIASHVRVNPGNHPMERVTQHHATYRRQQYGFHEEDDHDFFAWRRAHPCVIGHDVWLGHAVTIMPGVSIGTGAVVGSGAVVTKDVPPYQIAVGVPAKVIRPRFPDYVAEKLMQIAWWDWDRTTLEARFADLRDLPSFLEKYG